MKIYEPLTTTWIIFYLATFLTISSIFATVAITAEIISPKENP